MCEKYIKEILMRIERYNWFSPLLVLEIASKNPSLPFHVLKQYLIGRVKDLQKSIDKNRKKVEKTSQDIDSMKNNVSNMKSKAQLFQMKDCAECGKKLDLPFIHFMCMHSYHDYCLPSDSSIKECPQCSIRNNQRLLMSYFRKQYHFGKENNFTAAG
jgi:vacuolar protein sorting-associated protein 11